MTISRRKLITTGLAAAAGVTGLGVMDRLARSYGLIPPDSGGVFGPGETLTYAAQRLLTRHSMAREFSRSQISPKPFPNALAPPTDAFKLLQAGGFRDWQLVVDGLVERPTVFSLAALVCAARLRRSCARKAGRMWPSGSARRSVRCCARRA